MRNALHRGRSFMERVSHLASKGAATTCRYWVGTLDMKETTRRHATQHVDTRRKLYEIANVYERCETVYTTTLPGAHVRSPGEFQAAFAGESHVDQLARSQGMDPIQFRQINALKEGDPNIRLGRWPRIGLLECLEQIQQHPLWLQREQARQETPEELKGWKIGIGVAVGGWPG